MPRLQISLSMEKRSATKTLLKPAKIFRQKICIEVMKAKLDEVEKGMSILSE